MSRAVELEDQLGQLRLAPEIACAEGEVLQYSCSVPAILFFCDCLRCGAWGIYCKLNCKCMIWTVILVKKIASFRVLVIVGASVLHMLQWGLC